MKDPLPLRDYQVADLVFYMSQPRVANTSDPGVGKTASSCLYSYHRWANDGFRSLWLQPKSLIKKNHDELIRFTPFETDDLCMYRGTPKEREELRKSAAKVFLTTAQTFANEWKLLPPMGLLVIDEYHMMFKSHNSGRTQAFYEFMETCPYLVAMSGTMIDGRLDTVYPWIQVVEPRYYGTHESFMSYHEARDFDGKREGWINHHKISAIFARHAIRRTFEMVYGPESKVIVTERVEMNPLQRKAYKKFEKEAFLELETQFLDGGLPGVHAIWCRQIMGHPENVLGETITTERTGKDERLIVHLEDHVRNKKPFVIFASLVPEQVRIVKLCQELGLKVGLINGTVTGAKRDKVDRDFRAGLIDGVVASTPTAGVGFNWQEVNGQEVENVYFYSCDYMDSSFYQGYRRMVRGKRTNPLRIVVLEYENSIDQRIFEIIRQKSEMAHIVDTTREVYDLTFKDEAA